VQVEMVDNLLILLILLYEVQTEGWF
jgi:hypothetical protein